MIDQERMKQDLTRLRDTVAKAADALKLPLLREELAELKEEMNAPEFWNNLERSTAVNRKVSQIEGKLDRVLKKLQLACNPDSIEVFSDMALIATVGHGMIRRVGISAKLFSALADAGVNVRLIDQGSSELNIIVGVQNDDFEVAMRAIYASLTKEG